MDSAGGRRRVDGRWFVVTGYRCEAFGGPRVGLFQEVEDALGAAGPRRGDLQFESWRVFVVQWRISSCEVQD